MSWIKRRGQPSPNPTNPGVPMYNPNQHSNPQQPYQQWPEQGVQQQYNDWYSQSKGPSKTPPTSQYPQTNNTANYWQQQSYNPQLNYQQYNNQLPSNQHQNYYQNHQQQSYIQTQPNTQHFYQQQQQQSQQQTTHGDHGMVNQQPPAQQTETDPWNWEWEDNTNANSQPHQQQQHPQQQEVVHQNNITDSFANDTSWNWSVEDSNSSQSLNQKTETEQANLDKIEETQSTSQLNQVDQTESNNSEFYANTTQNVNVIEGLPSLPSLHRIKNENLTPQWSIESQVSQDSSEDVLLTSESDNRSNILSQSSTTSHSPTRQVDHISNVYRYDGEINQTESINDQVETANSEYYQENNPSCVDNIEQAIKEMNINAQFENKEIVSPDSIIPSASVKKSTPPLSAPPLVQQLGSSSTSDITKNSYKQQGGLSHKLREPSNENSSSQLFLQQNTPSAFTQIRPLNTENNLGVNLETVPDNSERPDQLPNTESIPKSGPRKSSTTIQQQWAENCEIAPINDRNQYLETGQLSDADLPVYNQVGNEFQTENAQSASGDGNDSLPPPGLRRLVLGQMEQPESSQANDNSLDVPPPGLSRKVIGSTASDNKKTKTIPVRQATVFQHADYQSNEEPPAGLHRMIPGESSSPESSSYLYQTDANVFQTGNFDDGDNYVSESELNQLGVNLVSQRSATIGADTPPVTNQQTINIDSNLIPSREGAVGIENNQQESDSNINNTSEENSLTIPTENPNRREEIEGGAEEEDIPQTKAPRDQTVGQNTTDDLNLTNQSSNQSDKHRSRNNYTTDSDHEQSKDRHNRSSSPGNRYEKDRRYYERRDSPDRFRNDRSERKYDKRRPKDRRYEDDTDYYSDKEKNDRRHDDREEYDRRFNSLRREKDRDRRRDRRDYERDDRRNDYYYNNSRYDEEYYNRSRPSSRSDSMHDSYRERGHRHPERDHDRSRHRSDREREHRRPRDPFNSFYQGYNFDPFNPYYQQYQYQYYENLRRTNPQAYAEMYRKYYQNQGGAVPHAAGYNTEDRASVHSGRSSANEELNKDRYTRQSYYSQQSLPHYYREIPNASSTAYTIDDSRLLDHTDSPLNLEDNSTIPQRLTPTKFSTAHVKASICSGNVINILPHYPIDGQSATVEIINLQSVLFDDEAQKEFIEFPGPLVKGITHKKTVIDYCENKIKRANNSVHDVESYILMWELLILLLRQNGMVVGTDIAELLMKNRTCETSRRQSVSSSSSTQQLDLVHEQPDSFVARASPAMQHKEDYITDKFREYLIYGSGREALEWAMKHGLWGHALFLASKLDKRTYANVMMRFANGLTMNDPLQTLYQLLSGRQPAAVTCVADEKWGDWRPHLAMILSNTSQRPDLDRKAITTLGDTLQQRGCLYAAHFCYLMAQVEFGRYGSQNVKLVLLSSSHNKTFNAFATNEAIFMTEIYEYACSLSDSAFCIPEFQSYKYLMATRMADHGLLEKALLYLERVSVAIKQDPSRVQSSLISRVCELADRLKYCDPVQDDGDLDNSKTDHSWLSDLKSILKDYNMGLITLQSTHNLTSIEPEQHLHEFDQQTSQQQIDQWPQSQQQIDYYPQQIQEQQQVWQQPEQQNNTEYNNQQINYQENEMQQSVNNFESTTNYQEQQYWNQQQPQQQWNENVDIGVNQQLQQQQQNEENNQQSGYWNQPALTEPTEQTKKSQTDETPQPQISMPNQSKGKNYFDSDESNQSTMKTSAAAAKPKPAAESSKQASTGWFGGIWNKLSLRPKNQMKLPDDKNPTIVWDSEKKRWVNLEEDNAEGSNELKPPPKMSEMFSNRSTASPPSLPNQGMQNYPQQNIPNIPTMDTTSNINNRTNDVTNNENDRKPPPGPNMFKLQRGRNIKKAYVDVFNPGGTKPANKGPIPSPEIFGSAAPVSGGNQMNYFVPQPSGNANAPTDFLMPQTKPQDENTTQISRWSSASSLSREVQYYMQQRPGTVKVGGAPMMYNPNQFSNIG